VEVLMISAVGMSLLFLALASFYGLLWLLTSAIRERGRGPEGAAEERVEPAGDGALLQAAAVAVALARAEAEMTGGLTTAPAPDAAAASLPVSPWWVLHHQRRLAPAGNGRRRG